MSAARPVAGWSSRSLAGPWRHRFFYAAIRLGGRRAAYPFLWPVALAYALAPGVARRCRPYHGRMFPGDGPVRGLARRFRHFLEFGRVLVDRAAAGILGSLDVEIRPEDRDLLRSLAARGRGVVLVTAHVGCWQGVLAILGDAGRRVGVLARRDPGDVDRHAHEHAGGEAPFFFIDPAGPFGGALEVLATLKAGGLVCMMGDRAFGSDRNTLAARFLGGEARTPFGPYYFASAAGAPLAVVLSRRTGPGRVRLWVAQAMDVPPGLGRDGEAYAGFAADYMRRVEGAVREAPYQYFNFYDVWS
ncbi:MAG: lysophospholipid acyltransferase family protein [Thermodesulfobacteriota bacterium]